MIRASILFALLSGADAGTFSTWWFSLDQTPDYFETGISCGNGARPRLETRTFPTPPDYLADGGLGLWYGTQTFFVCDARRDGGSK